MVKKICEHLGYALFAAFGMGLTAPTLVYAKGMALDNRTFENSPTLWLATIVGVIACGAVFQNAREMRGGVVGSALLFIGIGMLLMVIGLFLIVVPPWSPDRLILRIHDILFVFGYILMAIGGHRLLHMVRPRPQKKEHDVGASEKDTEA